MTEILVAMGLMGGVSIVSMKLMQETSSNESYVRFKSEVSKAVSIVSTHLNDPNSCKTMIVGRPRHLNATVPTTNPAQYINGTGQLTMVNKLGTASVVLLQHGQSYDGFEIPLGGIVLTTSGTISSPLTELVIVFDIKKRDISQRKGADKDRIVKKIALRTEVDGAGNIRGCGPIISDANLAAKRILCDSLKTAAFWDGAECKLNAVRCPFGEVPYQMTSLGSIICVPVTDKVDPGEVFDFATDACLPGQSVRLTTGADGKIRADCY